MTTPWNRAEQFIYSPNRPTISARFMFCSL